jgi:UDP-N-acetylmuramate--alanine ligase
VELRQPGHHNVLNALAAVAVGLEVEIGFEHVAEALASFNGVSRRFELRGEAGGVQVVDDYAHHPTEIRATLAAAAARSGRRLVVFQPHRYSRTQALADEFGTAFADADRVWVLDVYGAGEKPIEGVSGRMVAESARRHDAAHVRYVPDPETVVDEVTAEAQSGDTILTLGAGDVWKLGETILDRLRSAGVRVER